MRTSSLALGALLLAACGEPPPPPATIAIGPTPDTLVVPFVTISHGAGLSGDRWAVLGLNEGAVDLVDFSHKTVTPFPGMTSDEVKKASVLFGMGDTVVVGDWALRRFTRWTIGQPRLEAVPVPETLDGALPRAEDAAGNWYFQITPRAAGTGTTRRDSTLIVRADPLLTHFDTLAKLNPREVSTVEDGYGISMVPLALAGEDRWGVLPDGSLWVARTFQNRIDWYRAGGGKPVIGKLLPDPMLTVAPMDKEIYIQRYPEDQRDNARVSTRWAAIKPPFERVFAGPDGKMWLFKSAAALDSVRTFQVADSSGVRRYVTVHSRGMALAITREGILMGEEFPGGVRLLRFVLPKEALEQ